MANPALSAIAGTLNPGKWEKALLPDEQLTSFTKYAKQFHQWLTIVELDNMRMDRKWNLFIATGGEAIEDLVMHQTQIEMRHQVQVNANVGQGVETQEAIVPTPWNEGIEMCKNAMGYLVFA